jgi:hypothetical protein
MALRATDNLNPDFQVTAFQSMEVTPRNRKGFLVIAEPRRRALLTEEAARELDELLAKPRAFSPTPPRDLPRARQSFMKKRV